MPLDLQPVSMFISIQMQVEYQVQHQFILHFHSHIHLMGHILQYRLVPQLHYQLVTTGFPFKVVWISLLVGNGTG
jgi:hypothetical protein